MSGAKSLSGVPDLAVPGAGEYRLETRDFEQIAAMLYADSGICLSSQKVSLVYGRLVKRLRTLGLESFRDYCALIASAEGVQERQNMLAALTTNVTSFFRERHHFDHLRTTELVPLLERARRGGRVRIWSAGCSKGHEPFSIAMTVLGSMQNAHEHDVRILATDIDPTIVAFAKNAVYSEEDLAQIPKGERVRYFAQKQVGSETTYSALPPMRALVSVKELNLMGEWPMKGKFDIIFCRNVAIYFDAPTQEKLWGRFASMLEPGGLLCIGHSERVSGAAQALFEPTGTTMYRLTRGARR